MLQDPGGNLSLFAGAAAGLVRDGLGQAGMGVNGLDQEGRGD